MICLCCPNDFLYNNYSVLTQAKRFVYAAAVEKKDFEKAIRVIYDMFMLSE